MRVREILTEYNMSPKNLISLASKIDARVGIEFEMIVPSLDQVDPEITWERDDSVDERCETIDQVLEFFDNREYNSSVIVKRARIKMETAYSNWLGDVWAEAEWDNEDERVIRRYIAKKDYGDEDERESDFDRIINDEKSDEYKDLKNEWVEDFKSENFEDYQENWFKDEGLRYFSDVEGYYGLDWPAFIEHTSDSGEIDLYGLAKVFSKMIDRTTRLDYGGSDHYFIKQDYSVNADEEDGEGGIEFVSPVLDYNQMMQDLYKVVGWANEYGCRTDKSTGLHINVSLAEFDMKNLDYAKLALLLGDKYVLDNFNRLTNTYCESALDKIQQRFKNEPNMANSFIDSLKGKLSGFAVDAISRQYFNSTYKYTSIHLHSSYVEFRSPGGNWLHSDVEFLESTVARFIVALDAACDPEKYRKEYLKKLYLLLKSSQPKTENNDSIEYFARFAAGLLTKEQLIQNLRLIQGKRRGQPISGQLRNWKIYNNIYPNSKSGVVAAHSKEEALYNFIRKCQPGFDEDQIRQAIQTFGPDYIVEVEPEPVW